MQWEGWFRGHTTSRYFPLTFSCLYTCPGPSCFPVLPAPHRNIPFCRHASRWPPSFPLRLLLCPLVLCKPKDPLLSCQWHLDLSCSVLTTAAHWVWMACEHANHLSNYLHCLSHRVTQTLVALAGCCHRRCAGTACTSVQGEGWHNSVLAALLVPGFRLCTQCSVLFQIVKVGSDLLLGRP